MSKLKKINRGALFFITMLAVVIVMIVVESATLSSEKKNIMKTINSVAGIELGYMILPDDVKASGGNAEKIDAYIEKLKNETVVFYASNTGHSAEKLCLSDMNEVRERIVKQCINGEYYMSMNIAKSSILGIGAEQSIDIAKGEATVGVMIQVRVDDISSVNAHVTYRLVKEGSAWKLLSSEFNYVE